MSELEIIQELSKISTDLFERRLVAREGKHLDILVHDISWRVRAEVAKQGYGLEILVNDPEALVRRIARKKLEV
ncbi:hypothetical protein KNT64_gp079 [Pseudomonas phage PspYZU05]|uniref:Uncharacterized protein n=1 Tax=Pseudomonas phage PspYZU05 TaxID=1983556 RepID=A0A2U7NF22_9CAUD|nr:hypothetical protein KNT64_gp079 [Pseudomonas phage PspYZU05]ASD52031.1 hypothetical protein PspYZU05_79 [Pseudomonas phage PspYZU05]